MNSPSILHIGKDSGTSRHRAAALRRLGYEVYTVDPDAFFLHNVFINGWIWKSGCLFLEDYITRNVLAHIPRQVFKLVYVDGGDLVGPSLVLELKKRFGKVVNYNADDPYGKRDGRRWRLHLQSVPFYDLVVVARDCNIQEAFAAGARDVVRVLMAADEVAHAPRQISLQQRKKWPDGVMFAGTWMPERGPFLARLIELGVPLSIYGDQWHKAREWQVLRSTWRGGGLYMDDDYAQAIQCAKVNLGLLSKGNRDLTTTRSFEIPHLGGVLCAERTSEHLQLYEEDKEAVFWSSPEECAEKCTYLLKNDEYANRLRLNARRRCLRNGTTNESVLTQILRRLLGTDAITRQAGDPMSQGMSAKA